MIDHYSDVEIIARTLYGEARGELAKVGIVGLEAIASVIWNRWRKHPSYFGRTPRDVCLKPYQFSCWNKDDPNLKLLLSSLNHDHLYNVCQNVVERFVSGAGIDVVNGSDHYYATWIDAPSWANGKTPIVDIGVHRFYKLMS